MANLCWAAKNSLWGTRDKYPGSAALGTTGQKHTYDGTNAFLKDKKTVFFKFCSISMLPDPHSQYGSRSRTAKGKQIQADPDP
jgi:hypothetical protein